MMIQNRGFNKIKKNLLIRFSFITITGFIFLALLSPQIVRGQSPDQAWAAPINLSHSGANTNPVMVLDTSNVIHVVWQDVHKGSYYSHFDKNQWSPPQKVKFPFDNAIPHLLTNSKGQVYAFWIDSSNILYYSFVPQNNFGVSAAWADPKGVTDSALIADETIDSADQIHIAYIQSQDTANNPAGVYYRHSSLKGAWSSSIALNTSPYLRSLSPQTANIQISIGDSAGSTKLFVVWDNPDRKQVFLASSEDDGTTWDNPIQVDGPDQISGSQTPFKIRTLVENKNVLLIWQKGDLSVNNVTPGAGNTGNTANNPRNCTQFYQTSSDSGKTWNKPQEMLKSLNTCLQAYQFFPLGKNLTLLMLSTTQNQVFLLGWDGNSWGEPQAQPALSGFEDSEIFNQVKFGCRQASQLGTESLVVVGCDTGGGGDIWVTNRSLGAMKDWYPSPDVWTSPSLIATSQFDMVNPVAIAGTDESLSVFWNQLDTTNQKTKVIYYTNLNGGQWSRPIAVLSSPEGKTGTQAVNLDPKGRLLVTWSGGSSGQIYFSWANAAKAVNRSEWTAPLVIPTPAQNATSPDIIATKQGTIYIAYAIPLNESRGIYINQSSDDGKTWSNPVKVFDGAAAGWEMVNQPQIVTGSNGSLSVFWTRYTLPGGDGPLGLYEARSEDNGKTWSGPETMTEGTVEWSQAVSADTGPMQLIWIEQKYGQNVIKHQYSQDNGLTWDRITTISNLTNVQGQPAAITDSAGRLHFFAVSQEGNNILKLNHLMWDGQRWISQASSDISQVSAVNIGSMAADITPSGKLEVVFSGGMIDKQTKLPFYDLFFTNRSIEVPKTGIFNILPTSATIAPSTPKETPNPTATLYPTPSSTPTPAQSTNNQTSQPQKGNPQGGNKYLGLILVALLVVIIIVIFLAFLLRSIRNSKG